MPDQSLDQQTDPTTADGPTTTPDDTSANSPEAATPESVQSNVTRVSEGQEQQAAVTIDRDPVIGNAGDGGDTVTSDAAPADEPAAAPEPVDYSEMNLEELREELANRHLPKSGNKPDLIARLQESDAAQNTDSASEAPAEDADAAAAAAADAPVDTAGGGAEDSSANLTAPTTDADLPEDVPTSGVNPTDVENGGIQMTDAGVHHAEILQGLSAERRQQQLAAAREGSEEQQD